jgi:malate dehydrogenase (oxaloacetate-decarboxylating)
MDVYETAVQLHKNIKGKLEVISKVKLENMADMSYAYTPGVARPCMMIHEDANQVYEMTGKGNSIAVVTDGSAVLGLGNIGPEAALPVMEGKAVLFKTFANIDAYPICLATQDVEEIITSVKAVSPGFGGINLEDISAPRCFEIERRLREELDIPVFHDDQHGTAIAVCAGLINALFLVRKKLNAVKIVINGAGSAGLSICRLLKALGANNIVLVDKNGVLCKGETWMNDAQKEFAEVTNFEGIRGTLELAVRGADVFVGVSAPNVLTTDMVQTMAKDSIIFAMANPQPEIEPNLAKVAGARIVATGRSDYPNQINNVLVFPGIFRGALDGRMDDITEEMKVAAAKAIASIIPKEELRDDYIIPNAFDKRVVPAVRDAIIQLKNKTKAFTLKRARCKSDLIT